MTNIYSMLKSRDTTLPTKVHLGKAMFFSSRHVWIWDLDYKDSWASKNGCFWTVVLEKTLESHLDCKMIQPVHPKWNQSWVFFRRAYVEAETPILWPPDVKNWLIEKDPDAAKDWRREEKAATEDEMVGWHHRLSGYDCESTLRVGDGQRSMVYCSPWGHKEWDTIERLNWTELNVAISHSQIQPCLLGSKKCWSLNYLFNILASLFLIISHFCCLYNLGFGTFWRRIAHNNFGIYDCFLCSLNAQYSGALGVLNSNLL